jgi:phosphoglycolate phosphatase-like HAD superfamily hydrolase
MHTTESLQMRFSLTSINNIFLDGDNFLWEGTLKMYGAMFGRVLCQMAGLSNDEEIRSAGVDLFRATLSISDKERFPIWKNELAKRNVACVFNEAEYIAAIRNYFEANFQTDLSPAAGASELLDTISSQRAGGVPITVHLLSHNMDFALPLILNHFGWRKHFNGELLGAPFLSAEARRSKAEQAQSRLVQGAGIVIVAGDSVGDVETGNILSAKGFSVLTLAAATGVHTLEELRSKGAAAAVQSLEELIPFIQRLNPHTSQR